MSALVLSCGRTGTNMLLEIMRGSTQLRATHIAEHKQLFRQPMYLPEDYLSKCDTVYVDDLQQVSTVMDSNPHLKILWTIRDLRDCSLSKIYRGQPGNDAGGDPADDATFDGCIEDIEKMSQIYDFIKEKYPDRILVVKMEDVINNFETTVTAVCVFVGVQFEESMQDFTSRYRAAEKRRYTKLDKSQYQLHTRKYEIYDGFFKTHDIDLDLLFEKLQPIQEKFGYTQ